MISASVIRATQHPNDSINLLVTWRLTFPAYILPQLAKHRMFASNTASMRAIPHKRVRDGVLEHKVIPMWTAHQPGMQGKDASDQDVANWNYLWDCARNRVVCIHEDLELAGASKEHANRLLAPFSHVEMIFTGNWFGELAKREHRLSCASILDWYDLTDEAEPYHEKDIFELRTKDGGAQSEIVELVTAMRDSLAAATTVKTRWHVPDLFGGDDPYRAVAAAAKVSYGRADQELTHEAARTKVAELVANEHSSPLDHVQLATRDPVRYGPSPGWVSGRYLFRMGIFDRLWEQYRTAVTPVVLGPYRWDGGAQSEMITKITEE